MYLIIIHFVSDESTTSSETSPSCPYCKVSQTTLATHLKLDHSQEEKVQGILNKQLSTFDESRALAEITIDGEKLS